MSNDETFGEACVEVMSRVAASVAVMTLEGSDGVKRGMTITSLSSVSSDPPSVVMSIGSGASSHPFMAPGQTVGVNLLAADQTDYSIGFSWGKSADPFSDFAWKYGAGDTPVLTEAAAHFVCEIEKVEQYHGSAVVMAKVIDCDIQKDETLVYWRRAYFGGLVPVEGEVTGKW